ncbi:dentin sialophosphoprotein isoform X2 [Microplitis demolitor]|uniref:dentin sialophosphoprotein isoform X2 n=1 Tax=Microplitis demolitor TaxID=69319 RepID=UPI00044000AF|nr:dentin sialophosphoprotein isoform X2 [Microplitis demolitor]XP_008556711.1 dentin sialophosphoprotein isoform X2 [Microplitis demolitor]XP_053594912.1 dentin sialophosphoprotein isoform X2 [Microplitis demolitor]
MVVSRETNISTNIRAIIEQLNLNPVERRRLIDRTRENVRIRPVSSPANITIGVYGCNDKNDRNKIGTRTKSTVEIFPDDKIVGNRERNNSDKIYPEISIKKKNNNINMNMNSNRYIETITSPSTAKIIIGIWGSNDGRKESIIERTSSCSGKIDIKVVDDEEKRVGFKSRRAEMRQRIPEDQKESCDEVTRTQTDNNDKIATLPKEELPELESDSLNHTAAHHRISVRPKNRRPPRRTMTSTTSSMSCSTITTISENSDVLDSLELSTVTSSNASTPVDPKGITIMRKSSSRMSSRTSDIFEEFDVKKKPSSMASLSPDSLDLSVARMIEQTDTQDSGDLKVVTIKSSNRMTKLSNVYDELETTPKKRTSVTRLSKSPDSLDNSFSKSSEGFDKLIENEEAPTFGRLQNLISKSTDGFDKLAEHGEIKPMPRRLTNMISKSTDGFETSPDRDDPRPARRPSNQIYKFSDTVSKSSDSLEAIQALVSDDSIERRRSSFEIRPRRNHKTMSMSSDNFGSLDHQQPELQKISSTSDVYLTRANKHHGKIASVMSKSTDNFEIMNNNQENSRSNLDFKYNYKSYKRTISSESSDNLELEDRVESRKTRKPPKKIPNSILGMYPDDHDKEDYDRRPSLLRKPPTPRLQKSSESSELGSTDTLDSEKRNKSSDSTETLDSLDKDLDQDTRDDDIANNVNDKYDKNDSWSTKTMENKQNTDNADGMEEDSKSLTYTDKPYWRQSSESKENIDIHQLLTIVSRITDNGNNQRNSVPFTKKLSASPPSSPVVKQEDNKMLFNNLLTTKNDEELQNMLNGNISEVSTDTKSFKEKLIMFEKLGK